MAKSKHHDIRIFLTKFSEIFLYPRMKIKIFKLEYPQILQMVQFSLNKLIKDSESFFLEHLIHQFGIDQSMDVRLMGKPIASFTQIFEALEEIKKCEIILRCDFLSEGIINDDFLASNLQGALFRQFLKSKQRFYCIWTDTPFYLVLLRNTQKALLHL